MSWLLALSLVWLALAGLLIARALRQRGCLERLPTANLDDPAAAPAVAVIVPARDEATNIEACMRSLLDQRYPQSRLNLWVIDDHSTDRTAAIARRMAESEPRLTLLASPALPKGWTGKAHACWVASRSIPAGVEWLCFVDADMRAEKPLMASAIKAALADDIALLSLAPRHELKSFAERLVIPCGLCFLAFRQDLHGARPDHEGDVVATGQFFLARRDAYEEAGGHAAVGAEICEDLELARLLRRRGARVCLKDAGALLTTRMYTGWRTLWPGFAKNLAEMLGGSVAAIGAALISLVLAWAAVLLPLMDGVHCHAGDKAACFALVPALLASSAILGLHLVAAIHLGIPFWYGFLFPLGYTTGAAMTFDSVRWRLRGRVSWKGRNYMRPRPGSGGP